MKREKEDSRGRTKGRQVFLTGVFWLTLSTLLCKAAGFLTKVPLLRLLGTEGMGYYHTGYEVYAFLFVITTAGLPVALSMLISENREGRERTYRVAFRLFLGLGITGSLILWLFAGQIAGAMGNGGAAMTLRAIAPSVLFACLSAAVRGYFQGLEDMKPTAVSQVLESFGKLVFGVALAGRGAASQNMMRGAAGAALGISLGTGLSALYLLLYKALREKRQDGGKTMIRENRDGASAVSRGVLKPLLHIAIPVTVSSGVMTLTRLLDMVLILRRLQAVGMSQSQVNGLYGAYSTLALPLYSLLPMLITSVALPLVPGIAGARERGDMAEERRVVYGSFYLTVVLGLPASLGLWGFADPILRLLFAGQEEAIVMGAPLLSLLGLSTLGACLVTVTGSMLQAYRRPRVPILAMVLGGIVKLGLAYVLLGLPGVGIYGAPISTLLCNCVIVGVHLASLRPLLPPRQGKEEGRFCVKAVFASALSVAGAMGVYGWMAGNRPSRWEILPALCLCVLLYGLICLVTGLLKDLQEVFCRNRTE